MRTIIIHPIFNQACSYSDHYTGEMESIGDELGRDFVVHCFNGEWMSSYKNEGLANEDWYGWHADVLAPISGTVKKVFINPVDNVPGKMTPGRASIIIIETLDGVNVVLAHIREPKVKEGDIVCQGDVVAKMGNNGYSRHPHIHLGAWQGDEPLGIEIDKQLMADLANRVGKKYWLLGTNDSEVGSNWGF